MTEQRHINNSKAVKKAWKAVGKPGSLKTWARKTSNFGPWFNSKLAKNQPKRKHKPRITRTKASAVTHGGGKKGKKAA